MTPDTAHGLIARIRTIETDVKALQTAVAAERLAASDQKYLGRCFDLLQMELAAVQSYIGDLSKDTEPRDVRP